MVRTDIAFAVFGVGAILVAFLCFPVLHVVGLLPVFGKMWAYKKCQRCVHFSFKVALSTMTTLRLLTYEFAGAERLKNLTGTVVIANHPTLLDVVFIISRIPETLCVVKRAAWRNPFLLGIMYGTGYLQSEDPIDLVEQCVNLVSQGNNLVIFPEATRTVPGKPMKLKRGAAAIIAKVNKPFLPITIVCKPLTLAKTMKWYLPATSSVHYQIKVHDLCELDPDAVDSELLSVSNRRVNKTILENLKVGLASHD